VGKPGVNLIRFYWSQRYVHGGESILIGNNIVKMKNDIEDYTLVCVLLSAYTLFIMGIEINTEKITTCKVKLILHRLCD